MPWSERSRVSLRQEFIHMIANKDCSFAELCRRYGVSRKTGYKWRARADAGETLEDCSRRPHRVVATADDVQEAVLSVRRQHRAWGARKIRKVLERYASLRQRLPATSTITDILRRHGLITPAQSLQHTAWQRFERSAPNELWQMDFKGYINTDAGRCDPMTVLDDHSRFALGVRACADQTTATVHRELSQIFRRYGLPHAILCDNGPPWASGCQGEHTQLSVWLMRLGIQVLHGRPAHPQTQGKDERFHRTLNEELLLWERFRDLQHCQKGLDTFHYTYNWERPHEALNMDVPGHRYQNSRHPFPETLPEIEYDANAIIRRVCPKGTISFKNIELKIGKAFVRMNVALYPTREDGVYSVKFGRLTIKTLDIREMRN